MNINPTIFIFSVYTKDLNDMQNLSLHKGMIKMFENRKVPHIDLLGKYNGTTEASICVIGDEYESLVERLASEYGQESYLVSHSDRSTELRYSTYFPAYVDWSNIEKIGQFIEITADESLKESSYTYNPITNQYFTTRKD